MKRPTRKDITASLYGDETINNNRYANELEKYIEYLENKANDSEVIHSVVKRNVHYYQDLERITTDLLNAHKNKDMESLKVSVMALQVLKGV